VLDDIYRHWGAGDWTPRFEFYAHDFEWGWSTEFPGIQGVFHDTETPNSRLRAWLDPWDYWYCDAEAYLHHHDTLVVLTRYRGRGKSSGVEVDVEGAHVWKLRDGKATRLEVFADRDRALCESGVAPPLVDDELVGPRQ
jgi:ketosteroid isomerase-like protein